MLEAYFAGLRDARFEAAAAQFTDDCLYTHPPYSGGTERVLWRGRESVLRGFVEDRARARWSR